MSFSPNADALIGHNRTYAESFDPEALEPHPTLHLAVVACMDCRIDAHQVLGLGDGEAHIIRNAGGVITDDVIRSLCLSQRYLGTREVILLHHTDCGLQGLDEDVFLSEVESQTGVRPSWALESFIDPQDDVRLSMNRLVESPFIAHKDHIRGFVYDVSDGLLKEVVSA